MVGKKKILILTGAGVSAASGIPTFRDQDGFWKKKYVYAGESDPQRICTKSFFAENPEANWRWHLDFYRILARPEVKPNAAHFAIRDLQEYCIQSSGKGKVDSFLVT